MFLSAVLFVLFLAGCWLYCLTDAILTPDAEFPGLHKPVWVTAIAVTFILGAIAWVIARKSWRARHRPATPAAHPALTGFDAHNVQWDPRYPATPVDGQLTAEALARTGPIGPDDDPEFLQMLGRLISGTSDSGELSTILTDLLPGADWQHGH